MTSLDRRTASRPRCRDLSKYLRYTYCNIYIFKNNHPNVDSTDSDDNILVTISQNYEIIIDEGSSGTAKKSPIIISWADPLHRRTARKIIMQQQYQKVVILGREGESAYDRRLTVVSDSPSCPSHPSL